MWMPPPGMTIKDYTDAGGVIPNDTPNVPIGSPTAGRPSSPYGGGFSGGMGTYGGGFGRRSPYGGGMSRYGGIASLLSAFSQMTPEQFDSGMQRYQQFNETFGQQPEMRGRRDKMAFMPPQPGTLPAQAPTTFMNPKTVDASGQVVPNTTSQPTMTNVDNAQGGFGTGSNPYTQPYYGRSFGMNAQQPGYYNRSFGQQSGYQGSPYMPTSGNLYGQTQSPYGSTSYGGSPSYGSGKGGSMPSYRSGAGKGGYF